MDTEPPGTVLPRWNLCSPLETAEGRTLSLLRAPHSTFVGTHQMWRILPEWFHPIHTKLNKTISLPKLHKCKFLVYEMEADW